MIDCREPLANFFIYHLLIQCLQRESSLEIPQISLDSTQKNMQKADLVYVSREKKEERDVFSLTAAIKLRD